MLTIHEQERFAFCAGHPAYSEIAAACDEADQIETLEAEIEDLKEDLADLEPWRDGDKERELAEASSERNALRHQTAYLKDLLREVIADLNGSQCKTATGRKELARVMQTRLINIR